MYELIILLSALLEKVDEEAVAKVRNLIVSFGGNIKKEGVWEKRRLAYPVKKQTYGYYAVFEFGMEPEKNEELQKHLRLNNDILRFLILNKEGIKEEKARPARLSTTKTAIAPVTPKITEDIKGEKIKIEELDKKLEEILKE